MPHPRHLGCGQCPGLQCPLQGRAEPPSDFISPFPSLSSCFLVSWENGKLLEPPSHPFPISGPRSQHFLSWGSCGLERGQALGLLLLHSSPGLIIRMASGHDDDRFARLPGPRQSEGPTALPGPHLLHCLEVKGHTLWQNTGWSGCPAPVSRSSSFPPPSFFLSGSLPPFLFPSIFLNKRAQTYQTLLLGLL